MSKIDKELRYLKSHEWARKNPDGTITIGISDHAQAALGDLVYVDLPKLDKQYAAGSAAAVVESVKAASDVYSPVAGTVIAVNELLADKPETINADPYGAGWMFTVRCESMSEYEAMLSAQDYSTLSADAS